MSGADYIQQERRAYSLYVLQSRAIPHAADGLKAASRRVMWMARDGKEYKSSSLAGSTMPIHPHDQPEGAINTLAAFYGNNIPLLKGEGAFGTLLKPTAYGASRYTSVSVSKFANDVLFQDIEIIPMQENFDSTQLEPKHFLPIVPLALLNPQQGIAVGFACSILPRSLQDIVQSQIDYLIGKQVKEKLPYFEPTNNLCSHTETDKNGATRYVFKGEYDSENATTVRITNLPYGLTHEKLIERLESLEEKGDLVEFVDNSKDVFNIKVRFKKGILSKMDYDQVLNRLGLITSMTENMTVIDFDGEHVSTTSFTSLIEKFTDWRLGWYQTRYERLRRLTEEHIQRYNDIILAIKKNVGSIARKVHSRSELKEFLKEIGIVNLDYIADLPVYRFTEQEKQKVEHKLTEANKQLQWYQTLLSDSDQRRKMYIDELNQILRNYKKGTYNAV